MAPADPADGPGAAAIVAALGMSPHPEGGWYAETWRDPAGPGGRGAVTAIYFLLEAGQRSRWHRVDATEVWLWHAGAPLTLSVAEGATVRALTLGPGITTGERPQAVVPKDAWQSAESAGAWTLVSCVVAPAFGFAGFELAPEGWSPGGG